MKITPQLLSIPPYLSTPWKNIASLQTIYEDEAFYLVILLHDAAKVMIPGLSKEQIEKIFQAHAAYMEEARAPSFRSLLDGPFSFSLPLTPSSGPIDSLGPSMLHNEEQKNLPSLPPEVLKKISMIAESFGLEDTSGLPAPKENCNCIYCQVIRSVSKSKEEIDLDEEISEEDLRFKNWEIKQTDTNLYLVTNLLDTDESYTVHLGDSLGCTCGQKNCEHIREVLKT